METENVIEFKPITPKQEALLGKLMESSDLYVMDHWIITDHMRAKSLSTREASALIGVIIGFMRYRKVFEKEAVLIMRSGLPEVDAK